LRFKYFLISLSKQNISLKKIQIFKKINCFIKILYPKTSLMLDVWYLGSLVFGFQFTILSMKSFQTWVVLCDWIRSPFSSPNLWQYWVGARIYNGLVHEWGWFGFWVIPIFSFSGLGIKIVQRTCPYDKIWCM